MGNAHKCNKLKVLKIKTVLMIELLLILRKIVS